MATWDRNSFAFLLARIPLINAASEKADISDHGAPILFENVFNSAACGIV
jgi:hypothetical protein